MRGIRSLERDDLPRVASLYERVSRSGSVDAAPDLSAYFRRTCLDHPWVDAEVPSLVYEDSDGRIVGFLASHVRRLRFDGRPIRLACGGQMVTEPESRNRAVGAFLLRTFIDGPQDVTITDTAGEVTRRMWDRLGGVVASVNSMVWTRILRPWRFAGNRVVGPRGMRRVGALSSALDAASVRTVAHSLRPRASSLIVDALTPRGVVAQLPSVTAGLRVFPDYDEPFVGWLLERLRETTTYGHPIAHLLRNGSSFAGWYVYYSKPQDVAQVVQVAAREGETGAVLDHLFADAARRGASAVQGRVEPPLLESLARRKCIFRWQGEALVHASDSDLLSAILGGRSMLTRMDGEWWMGHHLERFAEPQP